MGILSILTLPVRTSIKVTLICLSIVWSSIKLTWTITFLLPLFSYLAFVSLSSFILAAAHAEPKYVEQLTEVLPMRQLRFLLCVLMAAVTEVPHYVVLLKVGIILYVKLLGVLNYWIGFLFMIGDVANIAVLVYNYAENLRSVDSLVSHFKSDPTDHRFSIGSLISKSLTPSYVPKDREQLLRYSDIKFYDAIAKKDLSIANLQTDKEGLLDIHVYGSTSSKELKPVILYIHGGAWTMGDKTIPTPLYNIMAEAGFLIVSVNYRLAPKFPQPAGFDDVMLALDWTRRSIAAFGGNKDFILTCGDSAGGHLAQLATLTAAERGIPVQGSILLYPVMDVVDEFQLDPARKRFFVNTVCGGDEKAAESLGLVRHISSDVPTTPVLVFHGEYDSLVKHATIVEMQKRLHAAGSEMDLVTLKNTHHAYMVFNSPKAIATSYLCADWAMRLYNNQKKTQ